MTHFRQPNEELLERYLSGLGSIHRPKDMISVLTRAYDEAENDLFGVCTYGNRIKRVGGVKKDEGQVNEGRGSVLGSDLTEKMEKNLLSSILSFCPSRLPINQIPSF